MQPFFLPFFSVIIFCFDPSAGGDTEYFTAALAEVTYGAAGATDLSFGSHFSISFLFFILFYIYCLLAARFSGVCGFSDMFSSLAAIITSMNKWHFFKSFLFFVSVWFSAGSAGVDCFCL